MWKRCLHCGEVRACRSRGLCWACYYSPGVRPRYPRDCRGAGNVGLANNNRVPAAAPDSATSARPGSPEKIEVLAERVRAGRLLWHPDDFVCCDDRHEADLPVGAVVVNAARAAEGGSGD